MPPRLSLFSHLRVPRLPSLPQSISARVPLSSASQTRHMSDAEKLKRRERDPYVKAQLAAKRAAILSRRHEAAARAQERMGDPVRGNLTPFVQSFDTTLYNWEPPLNINPSATESAAPEAEADDGTAESSTSATSFLGTSQSNALSFGEIPKTPARLLWQDGTPEPQLPLKHALTHAELDSALARSFKLTAPVERHAIDDTTTVEYQAAVSQHATEAKNAEAAMRRIVSLANGSAEDKLRVNTARCVNEFGRHETDKVLKFTGEVRAKERGGPDTGSSEVQVAVLTAKIRALADELERGKGKRDKVNKRNLRLMVHRRQKHLVYLKRSDKEGRRWRHCIEKLGLTPGAWEGEISL